MRAAVAAAVYGYVSKSGLFEKLPVIPVLGRTGSIALLAHFAARSGFGGPWMREAATIAATIAGYQLGSTGAVAGDAGDYPVAAMPDDDDD